MNDSTLTRPDPAVEMERTVKPHMAAVAGLVLIVKQRLQTDEGRWCLDRWRLRLPQVGLIYRNLAVSRFCRVLGTLLAGGVPIVRSLKISSDSTGNRVLSAAITSAAENITAGESLAAPLASSGHFPPNVVEMVAVAEQLGNWDYLAGEPDYASIAMVARWAVLQSEGRPHPDATEVAAFKTLGLTPPPPGEPIAELADSGESLAALKSMFNM